MNFDMSDPNTILVIVGAVIAGAGAIGSLLNFLLNTNAHKWKIVGLTALITLIGVGVFWHATNAKIQESEWTLLLQDGAPSCDHSNGGIWIIPDKVYPLTDVQCPAGALRMTASANSIPAEVDLEGIKGQSYSQTKLDALVTVTFSHSEDDYATMAGLLVQTPQQRIGGYGLWINSAGYWELRDGSGQVEANGTEPSAAQFALEMKVFQGKLYGSINNKPVFAYPDPLSQSSGVIGLIANGKVPGSTILFNNFKLSA